MSTQDTGGSAFPNTKSSGLGFDINANGMTLRDYFAAKAMQQFAYPTMYSIITSSTEDGDTLVAKRAYELADAMLVERDK